MEHDRVSLGNCTLQATASTVPYEATTDDNTVTLQSPVIVVPEFSFTAVLLAAFIICTIVVTALVRRKHEKPSTRVP